MTKDLSNNRLFNLDYLRGFAALGIMVYHYCAWGKPDWFSKEKLDATMFLGRIGVYGVSVFYVLSGLTLYYVYFNKMKPGASDLKDFYVKRFFRIFPLLWLTTALTIITRYQTEGLPGLYTIFINFTGLFGFFDWTGYIGTGVWSIGNELVFYIFFPIFVLLAKKSKISFYIFSAVLLALYMYFAFEVLDSTVSVENQKWEYIHPLNQVFLFLGGFLIGYFFRNVHLKNYISISLLIISLVAFGLIPSEPDAISIVSGWNRLWFTLICFTVCFSFYKITFRLPSFLDKALTKLGEASYSVYLIHPVVWAVLSFTSKMLAGKGIIIPVEIRIIVCWVLALLVSYLIYFTYEKYFIKLGKKFAGTRVKA